MRRTVPGNVESYILKIRIECGSGCPFRSTHVLPINGWQGRAGIAHQGAYRRNNLALSDTLRAPNLGWASSEMERTNVTERIAAFDHRVVAPGAATAPAVCGKRMA